MTAKHATRNAVLAYIRLVPYPRPRLHIVKYMFQHYSVTPAATRQQLQRLCKAGMLEEIESGRYQVRAAGDDRKERPVG